jgi:hypothetical protein
MLVLLRLQMMAIWLAPCIIDRVKHGEVDPTVCITIEYTPHG